MSPTRVDLIDQHFEFFSRNRVGLFVRFEHADGSIVVDTADTAEGRWQFREHLVERLGSMGDLPPGAIVPIRREALEPLRDAIDALLGRRYDESLVAEVRASLEVERRRVDAVLLDRLEALR